MLALALRNLGLSIYFGGGVAIVFGTRAIFAAADSRKQGGHFSGAVLRSFVGPRVVALAAMAIAAVLQHGRGAVVAVELGVLLLAGELIDRRLRALRAEIGGSTEGLDEADPRRERFGALHRYSIAVLAIQLALALGGLAFQ